MKPTLSDIVQPMLVEQIIKPEPPPVRVIKALTMPQPYATLAIYGLLPIETRSWETNFRGHLAIHAARVIPDENYQLCFREPFCSALTECGIYHPSKLVRGATLGIVKMVNCERSPGTHQLRGKYSPRTLAFGDFSKGRYLWHLENPRRFLSPYYCRGERRFWLCELPVTIKTTEEEKQVETALAQPSLFLPETQ